MKKLLLYLGFLLAVVSATKADDRFDTLKKHLAKAECVRFEFLSIIESDIFERVDTTNGEAYIAADGCYLVTLGGDAYLYDREFLYSYSQVNNQVTIEKIDNQVGEDIVFVTRLDNFYNSYQVEKNREYRLVKKDSTYESNIPDSLHLYLDEKQLHLKEIIYYDVNEELNRILFLKQEINSVCDNSRFIPQFPDSAELIKLY